MTYQKSVKENALSSLTHVDWAFPKNVRAFYSTRMGGCSEAPYASNNLALHVGDRPEHVEANRRRFQQQLSRFSSGPVDIQWLEQVHSCDVHIADCWQSHPPQADAVVTRQRGLVCSILSADCLPILIASEDGREVAAIHAGWRGLANGIIRQTVTRMRTSPHQLTSVIGPSISQAHFQVRDDVYEAFKAVEAINPYVEPIDLAFQDDEGGYVADLPRIAKSELSGMGVKKIGGGTMCTFARPDLYYSYRRDGVSGRMASVIWLQ